MAGKNDNFDALMAMMALKHIMDDTKDIEIHPFTCEVVVTPTSISCSSSGNKAWVDSKPIIDGIQKKLASKEEKTQQPNPNAYKDEEGNGGENNTEKDKTEESKQPSKTAMVEE